MDNHWQSIAASSSESVCFLENSRKSGVFLDLSIDDVPQVERRASFVERNGFRRLRDSYVECRQEENSGSGGQGIGRFVF